MTALKQNDVQDILFDLHRMQKKEEVLKRECHTLFVASKVLNSSMDFNEVIQNLIHVLNDELECTESFILMNQPGSDTFHTTVSTDEKFKNLVFKLSDNFERVLEKHPLISHDVREITEWKDVLNEELDSIRSALHIPLVGNSLRAILVCTHHEIGFFSKSHQRIANSLTPVARQAIINLENQTRLLEEIELRKHTEQVLKNLQNTLVTTAYKEGFAEHAISVLHNIGNLVTPLKARNDLISKDQSLEECISFCQNFSSKMDSLPDEKKKQAIQILIGKLNEFSEKLDKHQNITTDIVNKIADTISAQQKFANLKNTVKAEIKVIDLFNEVIHTFTDIISKLDISVEMDIDPMVEIYIERNSAYHTFLNLVSNAVDSIQERKLSDRSYAPYIKITCHEDREAVHLEVKDNGIGLEPQLAEEVFKYGYTTKEKGSGFGLHSCGNFIRANNGDIKLESEGPGTGASLQITLFRGGANNE